VSGPGPQLELGVDVEEASGVLGGPHVDRRIGEGVDLDLLAAQALGVADDQPLGREDRAVPEGLVGGDRLLSIDQD
jgi:hypothetical protein